MSDLEWMASATSGSEPNPHEPLLQSEKSSATGTWISIVAWLGLAAEVFLVVTGLVHPTIMGLIVSSCLVLCLAWRRLTAGRSRKAMGQMICNRLRSERRTGAKPTGKYSTGRMDRRKDGDGDSH